MNNQKKIELLELAAKNLNTCITLLDETIFGLESEEYYQNHLLKPLGKILDNIENRLVKEPDCLRK